MPKEIAPVIPMPRRFQGARIWSRRTAPLSSAFQMRIAGTVVIIDLHGTVAIAILNQKFDQEGVDFFASFSRALELFGIIRNSVDGDDLSAGGEPGFVGRPFPQHVN